MRYLQRPYPILCLAALIANTAFAGCYRWTPQDVRASSEGSAHIALVSGEEFDGTVLRATPESLIVRPAGNGEAYRLATTSVAHIDRRALDGKRSLALGAGLLVGGFAIFPAGMNIAQSRMQKVY